MYEPTMKGTWFRWGALDGAEKLLLVSAMTCIVAGTATGLPLTGIGDVAYGVGYRLGSGGMTPVAPSAVVPFKLQVALTIASVCTWTAAIILWVLFSRRQDELFNQVQNRSYGFGSLVTIGLMALWAAGEKIALLPPLTSGLVIAAWVASCTIIWMVDARRLWPS